MWLLLLVLERGTYYDDISCYALNVDEGLQHLKLKNLQENFWSQRFKKMVVNNEWWNAFIIEETHFWACETTWEAEDGWMEMDLQEEGRYFRDWRNKF